MKTKTISLKIKSIYRDLSKKEKTIANFILHDPKNVSHMTITEIAKYLGFADSTIFQFTKKLGYSGFRDFRNDLLTETFDPEISIHENIKQSDSYYTIAQKVFDSSIQSLKDTKSLIDPKTVERAAKMILSSDSINFFGVGGSNVVSYDAYHKFLRSPIPCRYNSDFHIQLMQASLLTSKDCAIIISHTGLTHESIKIAQTLKKANAKIIIITSYNLSPLTKYSDILLISSSEETGFRSESLSSRIAQLAIIDCLFTIVMFDNEQKSRESLYKIREIISSTKG
ncbi:MULTISPECIES: MurR/RpiR family transcriptional regulator [Bacillota]|uniref:MurR/RpiR family transcriptional regulator n=1 Tax=Faecalicoccus pleomorphus TaxID=1323 RepID=A0A3E3E6R9_9FIRM|nr:MULTISPECIES: MurR/RpiR family transcriptional regulator [Bacillota]MDB7980700.1 MurR/RpiR family transcriptional regulator [Faecalicoccus pleomorphus]MDB7982907.1 MurR/RpiR family transcriptional regulator [Faecalicoccus pleomorphus]MDB7983912.1 MurR/RpiR family transcriptional regulator [Faecalicoccus pleomorphus]MDB7989415.1 MurR/RpiR family transcriptional regulator [Faecalicoccus pleomorphus]MDB7993838.1 MurR/RpiR family transcriptional regulator [Faecalicoccus pleomorphus]